MPPSPSRPSNRAGTPFRKFAEGSGRRGETLASLFLSLKGYRILARRVKTPVGEIDLIARRGRVTVFVEVKARSFSHQEGDALMAVNLKGPWLLTSTLLPLLRNSPSASVVNIGSDAVLMGRPNYLHYVASKGGVQGMTYSMSRELGGFNIRVNTLSPGPVYTEVHRETVSPQQREAMLAAQSLHRTAAPEDMTALAAFLLSDESTYITGQSYSINGGLVHR